MCANNSKSSWEDLKHWEHVKTRLEIKIVVSAAWWRTGIAQREWTCDWRVRMGGGLRSDCWGAMGKGHRCSSKSNSNSMKNLRCHGFHRRKKFWCHRERSQPISKIKRKSYWTFYWRPKDGTSRELTCFLRATRVPVRDNFEGLSRWGTNQPHSFTTRTPSASN